MKPGGGAVLSCAGTVPATVLTVKSRLNRPTLQHAVFSFFIVPSMCFPAFVAGFDCLNMLIDLM